MKKLTALLVAVMALFMLTACSDSDSGSDNKNDSVEIESAKELLTSVWDKYADDQKFAAAGGDFSEENSTMDAPGTFSTEDPEALDATLGLPQSAAAQIDDAASLMHMMNANTFTGAAFHVTNADDVEAVAKALLDNIQQRQWMCGFPDKVVIITCGDYVVSAFGNGDAIDYFATTLAEVYSGAVVAYDEPIA